MHRSAGNSATATNTYAVPGWFRFRVPYLNSGPGIAQTRRARASRLLTSLYGTGQRIFLVVALHVAV
jgi:hypothetical protein